MIKSTPSLGQLDKVTAAEWGAFGSNDSMTPDVFRNSIENFFMTDPISRASLTMAACSVAKSSLSEQRPKQNG
jgi:NADH-quinone oxidoreductase subunit G